MNETWMLALLAVASLAGSALIAFAIRASASRKAALAALAAARGWGFSDTASTGGRAARTVLTGPGGDWTVTIVRGSSGGKSTGQVHWTVYERPDLALPGGAAILGPPLPDKAAALAQSMMGGFAGQILGRLLGADDEVGAELPRLEHVAGVAPSDGTLFATPEAREAFAGILGHDAFGPMRDGRNEMDQPILIRSTAGFRVRLRRALHRPEEIEALVGFGEILSETLRRRGPDG